MNKSGKSSSQLEGLRIHFLNALQASEIQNAISITIAVLASNKHSHISRQGADIATNAISAMIIPTTIGAV
jgi:hypothetical protein